MRYLATILLSGLISMTAVAPTSSAQTKSNGAKPAQRILPTNRWVTKPTPITLTANQQKKLDSISAKYVAEEQQLRKQVSGQSDMDMVVKTVNLTGKYQNMVWAILDPAQRTIFDKNIQAPVFGP